jgi:hypothetical protein
MLFTQEPIEIDYNGDKHQVLKNIKLGDEVFTYKKSN